MKAFLPERASHAVAFAAVSAAAAWLQVYPILADLPDRPYIATALEQFLHALLVSAVVVAIIAAVERAQLGAAMRTLVQGFALAAGVLAAAAAIALLAGSNVGTLHTQPGREDALFVLFAWTGLTASVLLSWYYVSRERATRAADALARAQVERQRALARIAQSRLEVLRSQLDPESVDRALAEIQGAFAGDAARADQRLDALIDHLWTALRASRVPN